MVSVLGAPITCSMYYSHIGLNTEQADHHVGVRVYLVGYIFCIIDISSRPM
jgi:hypothetical protein